MTSLQDKILSVFIDKRRRVLKDTEVSNALVDQGIPCTTDDILRHVGLLSPALFQLTPNNDRTATTIRVEPQVNDRFYCCVIYDGFFRLKFVKIF